MKNWLLILFKLVADIVLLNSSFFFGYMVKFGFTASLTIPVIAYAKLMVFITMLWLIIFNLAGLYKLQPNTQKTSEDAFQVTFGIFAAEFFTYIFIVYLYSEASFAKDIIIYASLFAMILINLARYLIWKLFKVLDSQDR